jgi:phenylpyruvate tautomerase PptA (4-oxalocrotonate tautomerase family)
MPRVRIETSVLLNDDAKNSLLSSVSKRVGEVLEKPEKWMMVSLSHVDMILGGTAEPAAAVDVNSIGITDLSNIVTFYCTSIFI